MIHKFVDLTDVRRMIRDNKKVFVKFETPWCGVCKASEPILKPVFEKFANDVEILYVDADKSLAWAEDGNQDFALKLVPTFVVFHNGEEVWRKDNFVPPHEIKQQLENLVNETY